MLKRIYNRLKSFLWYHSMLFINYILLVCFWKDDMISYHAFVYLITSYLLTGLSAYFMNDFYDKKVDTEAGKANIAVHLNSYAIGLLVLSGFTLSFLLIRSLSIEASYLIGVQFLALLAYSHPSIRLKSKPIPGVLTDAIYAYIVPVLVVYLLLKVEMTGVKSMSFLLFNFSLGIRDILLHQKQDKKNDQKSNITTFATEYDSLLNPAIKIFEWLTNVSLILFLTLSFYNQVHDLYLLIMAFAYVFVLLKAIINNKESVKHNYLVRFYILMTTLVIGEWLIQSKAYVFIVFLFHPYTIQFLVQLKIIPSTMVNYLLYYSFKLFGRDLKKDPLFKK